VTGVLGGFRYRPPERLIAWPPGSGRVGGYTPHELEAMRALLRQRERGEISAELFEGQVTFLHDLKVDLDASMLPDDPAQSRLF
jgi:hypothetical protein